MSWRPSSAGSSGPTARATAPSGWHGHTFAYLWEPTQTVGLKQTLTEQLALVAERPDVFEIQFTAGQFGWVVVYLAGVDRLELAELTYEAWRLTGAGPAGRGGSRPVARLNGSGRGR